MGLRASTESLFNQCLGKMKFGVSCKPWEAYRPSLILPFFSWQAPRETLAQTVLAEVPTQMVSYFKAQGWAPLKAPPAPAKSPSQAPQA